jgi:diamine N-acetyltransferase
VRVDGMTMIDLAQITTLEGRHVRLRRLRVEDAALTLRWRSSERAALLNRGAETVEAQAAWIASRGGRELNFVIELRDARPVGMLSLVDVDLVHGRAEPARFLIGEPAAVEGVPAAVEAMLLLYELAFERLGLRRLYGTVASGNPLMLKWQKYLGMREEGRLRAHLLLDGRIQDAVCLGLLAEEWRAVARPRMRALVLAGTGGAPAAARSPSPAPTLTPDPETSR